MADSSAASIGRFSSQMLTYLGTQRTVSNVSGTYVNTFKYASGTPVFPDPGNVLLANTGINTVGSFSLQTYDSTRAYFLSRGVGSLYADTMTALTMDIAAAMGITPQSLLEQSEISSKLLLSPTAYALFNNFRDPSHQVGIMVPTANKSSLKAKQIRA